MKKYSLLFLVFLTICTLESSAQKKHVPEDPKWIKMMDDPHVNYFEAVKNYEAFWKGKVKPWSEQDEINAEEARAHYKPQIISKRELRKAAKERVERAKYEKYAYDCKRFEHWMLVTKPYVQADGHILSKEEQLKIWQDQRH